MKLSPPQKTVLLRLANGGPPDNQPEPREMYSVDALIRRKLVYLREIGSRYYFLTKKGKEVAESTQTETEAPEEVL